MLLLSLVLLRSSLIISSVMLSLTRLPLGDPKPYPYPFQSHPGPTLLFCPYSFEGFCFAYLPGIAETRRRARRGQKCWLPRKENARLRIWISEGLTQSDSSFSKGWSHLGQQGISQSFRAFDSEIPSLWSLSM